MLGEEITLGGTESGAVSVFKGIRFILLEHKKKGSSGLHISVTKIAYAGC